LVAVLHAAAPPPAQLQYLEWDNQYSLATIEAIAENAGIALPAPWLPVPVSARAGPIALTLPATIEGSSCSDEMSEYNHRLVADHAPHFAGPPQFWASFLGRPVVRGGAPYLF